MSAQRFICFFTLLVLFLPRSSFSQSYTILGQDGNRVVQAAVPFLLISPDTRAAGMGETGVATTADANSAYWNPAKMVRLEESLNVSYSFTPWLRKVVSDMYLQHVALAFKLRKNQSVGVSVTRLDLGDIQLISPTGGVIQTERAYDQAISFSYAFSLNENLSLGVSTKFVIASFDGIPPVSLIENIDNLAFDLGALYQKETTILGKDGMLNLGLSITNLGPKMDYIDEELFLPATLRLGTALTTQLNANHSLSWSIDISKLLVPTPPIYATDDSGRILRSDPTDPNSPPVILRGKDPNRGWLRGTFGSFADAPDGFSEELREVIFATGLEYWFKDIAALRGGYYRESVDKGDRQYSTAGIGCRYRLISLDLSYLVPHNSMARNTHPLQNTFRFSLMLQMGEREGL